MIRRLSDQAAKENVNMRGGEGTVVMNQLLDAEKGELYDKGRLYNRIILNPGCSIGQHVHEGEMESFVITSGRARYNDNGTEVILETGDVALCKPGETHAIACEGDVKCELIAQILFG